MQISIFSVQKGSLLLAMTGCVLFQMAGTKKDLFSMFAFSPFFAPATSLSTQLLVVTIGQKKSHKRRKTAANIDTFPVFLCSSNPSPPPPCCNSVQPQDCCFRLSASYFDKLLEKTIRHSPLVQQKW